MTHIAGMHINVNDRFIRQRCAWCGEILVDEDLLKVMVIGGCDGLGLFEVGAFVRVDGRFSSVVNQKTIPHDCCYAYEISRHSADQRD
jgi:hypothetical protein